MHDLDDDPESTTGYEWHICGEIVVAETRLGDCPGCKNTEPFRNRAFSAE